MLRPIRKTTQKKSVESLIIILEKDIEPKFGNKRKYLYKHLIHEDIQNKYHKILFKIVRFLEELKSSGGYKNPMESIIRDYLTSLYSYYWRFGRTPTIFQLSPSKGNQIKFQEWIIEFEVNEQEPYWFNRLSIDCSPVDFVQDFNIDTTIAEV